MFIECNFKFRGNRNYVHSTDIYKFLQTKYPKLSSLELLIKSKSKNQFVYDEKKGSLYFNENGKGGGWGDGGLLAILQGKPELGASDFTIV